ncbi:MAG: TIGR03668 family PPOX class F420-dependent oxidoreductase [Candidatus Dormibacterales bacterium]
METAEIRRRLAEARVGRLATVSAEGRPHLVPVCFVLDGGTIFFAVDSKPKASTDLKRLRNIAANPLVSILVDHYAEDWTSLWWVRADGTAAVLVKPGEAAAAIDLLVARYPQYRSSRPGGPVVAVTIRRLSGWSGS